MSTLTVPNFSALGKIIDFGAELSSSQDVVLDFSRTGFAKPMGMVLLAQIILRANREGRISDFTGAEPMGYPANMGFFDA